ncbi:lysozyme inhibitor LprI family protein [Caenimonas sedimenti]|nr:hypothetical protein [Caenimonas sedimenti]
MPASPRSRLPLFLGGLALGAALATAVSFALRTGDGDVKAPPEERQAAQLPVAVACPPSAVVPAADAKDGQARFDGATDASKSIVSGKEAAASGRDRDAEAAFLAACRVPVQPGNPKATLLRADAMYNLARHYASLAEEGASGSQDMLKRAGSMLDYALAVYQSQLGQSDEKVQFALRAIATIREHPKQAEQRPRADAVSRPTEAVVGELPRPAVPKSQTRTAAIEKRPAAATGGGAPSPEPKQAVTITAPTAKPSFDCAKARSTPERLICSDEELANQDRELGRIYARAKREAPDPAAFQRLSDREWRRREAECRTRDCLLDWYAERRRQLLGQ